ncbi:MAG: Hpt domain-containing protein [Pseudomonadales bacterium]|nr:Hpt domain-containing protein [Pseudomonadales bacterium]
MQLKNISSKPLIISLILGLCVSAIALSFYASHESKKSALVAQTKTLKRVIEVASNDALADLYELTVELAKSVVSNDILIKTFKTAETSFDEAQSEQLNIELGRQFHQRFVTAGLLEVIKIRAYDTRLHYLGASNEGRDLGEKLLYEVIETVLQRKKAERFKPLAIRWQTDNSAYYSLFYPVGGLRLAGYVEIVVAPAHNLGIIDQALAAPVTIRSLDQKPLYQSSNWQNTSDKVLEVVYRMPLSNGNPGLELILQEDIQAFKNSTQQTQTLIVGVFVLLAVFGLPFSLLVLRKNLFQPLEALSGSVSLIASGDMSVELKPTPRKDELGSLVVSVESMRIDLKDVIENLDHKVAARTEELVIVQDEITDILDSVEEAIFTFNLDKSVNAEHSNKAERLFSTKDFEEANLFTLLDADEAAAKQFDKWLSFCAKNKAVLKQWKQIEKLTPIREIKRQQAPNTGKPGVNNAGTGGNNFEIIQLTYQPIVKDNQLTKIMVLAMDVTDQRLIEKALEKSKHDQNCLTERVVAMIAGDQEEIENWINLSKAALEHFTKFETIEDFGQDVDELFREVHTLKGHSGTLGFGEFANALGLAENNLANLRNGTEMDIVDWSNSIVHADSELANIQQLKQKIFAAHSKEGVWVNKTIYEEMLGNLKENRSYDIDQLMQAIEKLDAMRFESFCRKYTQLTERSSTALGKKVGQLNIETPDVLIKKSVLRNLDDAIVHLLRNAIDHGIEPASVRDKLGKDEGKISIAATMGDEQLSVVIRDDGRGIDPDHLARVALKKDLLTTEQVAALSKEEKMDLIFMPGFTSKQSVTALSGRGVGMDAVANCLNEIGASISMHSEINMGTRFTISIPHVNRLAAFDTLLNPEGKIMSLAHGNLASH